MSPGSRKSDQKRETACYERFTVPKTFLSTFQQVGLRRCYCFWSFRLPLDIILQYEAHLKGDTVIKSHRIQNLTEQVFIMIVPFDESVDNRGGVLLVCAIH